MRRRHIHGFTLIELLVNIAIIAILAAILFPVFSKAREKGRQARCLSNQRQIAMALTMYTADNEERMPPAATMWSALNLDPGILICPSVGPKTPNSYVYNYDLSERALCDISNPSRTMATCDGMHIGKSPDPDVQPENISYDNTFYTERDLRKRHNEQALASYVDGHVERLRYMSFHDNFEDATLNPFWTKSISSGDAVLSTEKRHLGKQCAKFETVMGGNKEVVLSHKFPGMYRGVVSVWIYDTCANNNNSNYFNLRLNDLTSPIGQGSKIGGEDWRGDNYICGVIPNPGDWVTPRKNGWHLFSIDLSETTCSFSIDRAVVKTYYGSFQFNYVQLDVVAPDWRPPATFYFDDFSIIYELS